MPGMTKEHWVRDALRVYAELSGGGTLTPGRLGKALKPLVDREGWTAVRVAWVHFVTVMRHTLSYATPEHFARTYPDWTLKPKMQVSQPLVQEVQRGQRMCLEYRAPDDPGPSAA